MKHKFKSENDSQNNFEDHILVSDSKNTHKKHIKREIERTNAKLRHFRGVAANVMNDALKIWQQMWDNCQDTRTCEEIIEDDCEPSDQIPMCGWQEFREKLHLLGHYLDYTQRLCEGSIDKISKDESEV